METYKTEALKCENCGAREKRLEVPKGVLKSKALGNHKCPNCGCRTMREVIDPIL
jgi:exosome complex RNA-binding protein Csl4